MYYVVASEIHIPIPIPIHYLYLLGKSLKYSLELECTSDRRLS